jgi:hypothetical protein
MNKKIREKTAKSKRRIIKRLKKAHRASDGQQTLKASNIHYEISDKFRAITWGGIGAIHKLVREIGLAEGIDRRLRLLKFHVPYYESDHVLNIAYNIMCGGIVLEDIELRRNDEVYLDALGTESIPDPTTAGDFCRRFSGAHVDILQEVINQARLSVWRRQGEAFFRETARIDADGSLVTTTGECKEGMDISYKGTWGYHPLVVSLANTAEPLYIVNREGSRPSHEGAPEQFDKAIALCRNAGFKKILLRGDTDFSLTTHFDRWSDERVRFVFGYDARANMKEQADQMPENEYHELVRRADREIKTQPRLRPENVKEKIIKEREFRKIHLNSEDLTEFSYKPTACKRDYRVVAVRKNLSIEKGHNVLFDDIRYFFYITNDFNMPAEQVVREAAQRCDQENLIAQLQSGVRALHAPLNTLNANWAYMVMAALAWSLKAWTALLLPVFARWRAKHLAEKNKLLRMEFRTFVNAFITQPCQIIKTGRRIVYRLLSWNPWQHVFFRFLDAFET